MKKTSAKEADIHNTQFVLFSALTRSASSKLLPIIFLTMVIFTNKIKVQKPEHSGQFIGLGKFFGYLKVPLYSNFGRQKAD